MRHTGLGCVLAVGLLSLACTREEGAPAPGGQAEGAAPDATSAAPAAERRPLAYACADGTRLDVRIERGSAVVATGGETFTLAPVEGASDARFAGPGASFVAQGERALFARTGARPVACTAT